MSSWKKKPVNPLILTFEDFPDFQPNLTPKQILQLGSFGGTYFRPIYSSVTKQTYGDEVWLELPQDWLEGLDIETEVASSEYHKEVNRYRVKSGASLDYWESKGWIKAQDPYGWFQWYCRFYQGRRTEDDQRQVDRWVGVAGRGSGRWRNFLIGKIQKAGKDFDDETVSPVTRQTLQHWAYHLTEEDYRQRITVLENRKKNRN